MQNKHIALFVVALVIVCGGSFYGGTKYQAAKTPAFDARMGAFAGGPGGNMGFGNRMGGQGQARGGMGGGFAGATAGEVVTADANSLTLKLRDGGSKIVLFSTSTRIGKMSEGSAADLAAGTQVSVSGSANADGSVTAQSVQILPAGAMMMGGASSTMPVGR